MKSMNCSGSFIIGHVGNFNKVKNHGFIIDIFYELCKTKPNSKLILVGDGPEKSKIIQKVNDLKIQNQVIFLGKRKDVNSLLNAFDVFIFPSLYEGLGISVVEAQMNGLPCVVSDAIPKEAIKNKKVISLSNEAPIEKWVEMCIKTSPMSRISEEKESYLFDEYSLKNIKKIMKTIWS